MELAKERTIKSYMYRYSTAPLKKPVASQKHPGACHQAIYSKSEMQLNWIALLFSTQASPLLLFHDCCRLAQAVLAREEPEETFLKSVPQHLASLQIIHPVRAKSSCTHQGAHFIASLPQAASMLPDNIMINRTLNIVTAL